MKRIGQLAVVAVAVACLTGTAVAGNGNGSTPPGQEKKADSTQPTAAQPTSQPASGNPNAPGQEKKASSSSSRSTSTSKSQAKQQAKASTSSSAGVKPSSTTGKWTHCSTGGTATNATCSGNGPKADGSKQ